MEWYDGSQRDITGDFLTCLNCPWLQAMLRGEREEEEMEGTEEDEKTRKVQAEGGNSKSMAGNKERRKDAKENWVLTSKNQVPRQGTSS